jgi:hypothetical protein
MERLRDVGSRVAGSFFKTCWSGENFYEKNFALLSGGFASTLALHVLATVDPTGEGEEPCVIPEKITKKKKKKFCFFFKATIGSTFSFFRLVLGFA